MLLINVYVHLFCLLLNSSQNRWIVVDWNVVLMVRKVEYYLLGIEVLEGIHTVEHLLNIVSYFGQALLLHEIIIKKLCFLVLLIVL